MMSSCPPSIHLTPTERRILSLLSDDLPHTLVELHSCLDDELSSYTTVRTTLTRIRQKIRPLGEDILCVAIKRRVAYRHIGIPSRTYLNTES